MSTIRKTGTSSSGSASQGMGGILSAIPVRITGILRRFWRFAKKYTSKFAEELEDSDAKEKEFISAVERDSKYWT